MTACPDPLVVIRDDVRAAHAYAVLPSEGLIKLDLMESPFGLPAELARAMGDRLAQVALNRYPPGDPHAFKVKLGRAAGLPERMALMLGNGSDELIHLVVQACARPGAVIMAPSPSFVFYEMAARFNRCSFVPVPLDDSFQLDVRAMRAAMAEHRPAVVFIADPNNPTGNLFEAAAVEAVLDAAPGLVVLDEAYLPYAQHTWMPRLAARPNLLLMRTLSKLGFAGVRLGYLCGSPALIGEFEKVRPPFNVNVLTLAAMDLLLDHLPLFDGQAAVVRRERSRVAEALRARPGITVFPSDANFLLVRVPNAARTQQGMRGDGVLVKNVSAMHPRLQDCLRVSIGTPAENEACLTALLRHL